MQPASDIRFEQVGRDDPAVLILYADFIREADGPLDPELVDIEAEIAAGPPANLDPPDGILLLARVDGDPAAIGGVRHLDTPIAEVKSMYVVPAYRGAGLARRLLDELHAVAREHGCRATRLDTSALPWRRGRPLPRGRLPRGHRLQRQPQGQPLVRTRALTSRSALSPYDPAGRRYSSASGAR